MFVLHIDRGFLYNQKGLQQHLSFFCFVFNWQSIFVHSPEKIAKFSFGITSTEYVNGLCSWCK